MFEGKGLQGYSGMVAGVREGLTAVSSTPAALITLTAVVLFSLWKMLTKIEERIGNRIDSVSTKVDTLAKENNEMAVKFAGLEGQLIGSGQISPLAARQRIGKQVP